MPDNQLAVRICFMFAYPFAYRDEEIAFVFLKRWLQLFLITRLRFSTPSLLVRSLICSILSVTSVPSSNSWTLGRQLDSWFRHNIIASPWIFANFFITGHVVKPIDIEPRKWCLWSHKPSNLSGDLTGSSCTKIQVEIEQLHRGSFNLSGHEISFRKDRPDILVFSLCYAMTGCLLFKDLIFQVLSARLKQNHHHQTQQQAIFFTPIRIQPVCWIIKPAPEKMIFLLIVWYHAPTMKQVGLKK